MHYYSAKEKISLIIAIEHVDNFMHPLNLTFLLNLFIVKLSDKAQISLNIIDYNTRYPIRRSLTAHKNLINFSIKKGKLFFCASAYYQAFT